MMDAQHSHIRHFNYADPGTRERSAIAEAMGIALRIHQTGTAEISLSPDSLAWLASAGIETVRALITLLAAEVGISYEEATAHLDNSFSFGPLRPDS